MKVSGIDERHLRAEQERPNLLVFIYEGGDAPGVSWSVDSYLITDTDLAATLAWLGGVVPVNACWSLGVVLHPDCPTPHTELEVAWIIGADVLNIPATARTPPQQALAREMLARRHDVSVLPRHSST